MFRKTPDITNILFQMALPRHTSKTSIVFNPYTHKHPSTPAHKNTLIYFLSCIINAVHRKTNQVNPKEGIIQVPCVTKECSSRAVRWDFLVAIRDRWSSIVFVVLNSKPNFCTSMIKCFFLSKVLKPYLVVHFNFVFFCNFVSL